MAPNLKDYLAFKSRGEFRAVPHYFKAGDHLTYYATDERCHSKRLDGVVTVFVANGSGRFTGCRVDGVSHILRAGGFRVGDSVTLGSLFRATFARGGEVDARYLNFLEEISSVAVGPPELAEC